MIKISLIRGEFSPLNGEVDVSKLLGDRYDDVVLSCEEPRYKTNGYLERTTANYISNLLPCSYVAKWDGSTEGYHIQNSHVRESPAIIDELRFKVLLCKEK